MAGFLVSVSTLDCPHVTEDSDSLHTNAESNPKPILGEVEEDSFLIYQAKGDTAGFCLERVMCLNPREVNQGFYNCGSEVGSLTRLRAEQGLHCLHLTSGDPGSVVVGSPSLDDLLWTL